MCVYMNVSVIVSIGVWEGEIVTMLVNADESVWLWEFESVRDSLSVWGLKWVSVWLC